MWPGQINYNSDLKATVHCLQLDECINRHNQPSRGPSSNYFHQHFNLSSSSDMGRPERKIDLTRPLSKTHTSAWGTFCYSTRLSQGRQVLFKDARRLLCCGAHMKERYSRGFFRELLPSQNYFAIKLRKKRSRPITLLYSEQPLTEETSFFSSLTESGTKKCWNSYSSEERTRLALVEASQLLPRLAIFQIYVNWKIQLPHNTAVSSSGP